jgi:hypothetical protein
VGKAEPADRPEPDGARRHDPPEVSITERFLENDRPELHRLRRVGVARRRERIQSLAPCALAWTFRSAHPASVRRDPAPSDGHCCTQSRFKPALETRSRTLLARAVARFADALDEWPHHEHHHQGERDHLGHGQTEQPEHASSLSDFARPASRERHAVRLHVRLAPAKPPTPAHRCARTHRCVWRRRSSPPPASFAQRRELLLQRPTGRGSLRSRAKRVTPARIELALPA